MEERFELGPAGRRVRGVFVTPGPERRPCVVLSHGLLSSKESTKYLLLADVLAERGMASCRFDFHGCVESDGRIEETTLTERIGNLDAVTEWVMRHPSVDPRKVGLLGSSFGSSTSLVKAARDGRIRCVALWATPYTLDAKEEPDPEVTFKESIYDDFQSYDLLAEARKVSRGLVIHGELDRVVPAAEGEAVYRNLAEPKAFELIRGADHAFTTPAHRDRAIALSVEWFMRFLKDAS